MALLSPGDTHWYRLKWTDPDDGRVRRENLPRSLNKAQCVEAARRKSEQIAERKRELAMGAPVRSGKSVTDALGFYFASGDAAEHRQRTLAIYRGAAAKLESWCATKGIATVDDLDPGKLYGFRDYLVSERKRAPVSGAKGRGVFATTADRRSPAAINQDLRAVGTILRRLRSHHMLPRLTREEITDSLTPVKAQQRNRVDFLMPADCQRLLEAALRHDAERVIGREDEQRLRQHAKELGITRRGLAQTNPEGTTPRYTPVARFLATVLLSGMRFSEAANLRWDNVDLGAVDAVGSVVGTIYLTSDETKTGADRTIYLNVCPTLRALLARMKLASAGKGRVFGSRHPMTAAVERLQTQYGAPEFTFQKLRRTCATYLIKSPGIWGSAAHANAASQLGHSTDVAEKRYKGAVVPIPASAKTLEAAMQIEAMMARVIAAAGAREVAKPTRSPHAGAGLDTYPGEG